MFNSTLETALKVSNKRNLIYLPEYANYILTSKFEEFVIELIKLSKEEELPLLKYFSKYSMEELLEIGKSSNIELLDMLSKNQLGSYIEKSTADFINNMLPKIDREEVLAEDITIISLIRRRAFRNFLNEFAASPQHFNKVMEEVDVFTAATEMASFNAYLRIQQEKIQKINAELKDQHEKLLEAQQLAEMGSFIWDKNKVQNTSTQGALNILGVEISDNLENLLNNIDPVDRENVYTAIFNQQDENGMYECEFNYNINGIQKRLWSRGNVNIEDGSPVLIKGTIRDISRQYKLLQQLQESEDLHKQAQALTHIGNWSWNIEDNSIIWSDEMFRIYGLEPQSEKITFDRFISLVHPDEREKRIAEINESLHSLDVKDYYLRIVNPDGNIKLLKGKGEIITDDQNRPVRLCGTCQDVTREFLMNTELQEKEKNFQHLIRSAPDAVVVIDSNSTIILWNPKATEIFGWTSEEVLGKHLSETIVPQRYKEAHAKGIERYLKTGEAHILNKTLELIAVNKQGLEFYISLTISETTQWGKASFISFIRDISQQKNTQHELQRKSNLLEYKNLELQRINKELESFNFAASHDLQEPLRKIYTYTGRIVNAGVDNFSERMKNDFDKILQASSRMQNLIQDLLSYSQNTLAHQETQEVDLNEMVDEVKNNFIDNIEEKKITITAEKLPLVKVVKFQFVQLFINLFTNAIKYQRPDVSPSIHIASKIVEGTDLDFDIVFSNRNYLEIQVADNGIGFEQEYAEKIFGLFTRLHNKDKYSGTGIGLATCKKIIHNHEGFIKAKSAPGKGSIFYIYLPEELIMKH